MLNHVLHSGRMKHWTPNQLVSYNLIQARKLKGWVQEKAVAEVNAVEGEDAWTVATWSAAERSVDGKRVRQFSADDLVAFSRAFKLPLMWWLTPPGSDDTEVWFHLFSGYEEAKEGLAAQWAILSLLEDFSGAFTARLNRTGLGRSRARSLGPSQRSRASGICLTCPTVCATWPTCWTQRLPEWQRQSSANRRGKRFRRSWTGASQARQTPSRRSRHVAGANQKGAIDARPHPPTRRWLGGRC